MSSTSSVKIPEDFGASGQAAETPGPPDHAAEVVATGTTPFYTLSTVISLLARRLECTRELLQIAWRALAVLTSGQCLASLFLLAASLSPPLRDWPASCAGDERCTEEAGRQSRVLTIFGAFQITLFLASVPVLLKLRRAINEDMCAVEGGEGDVPLGWHVPPEPFAPDSSESESDGHVRTRLLGRRAQSQDHHGLGHGRGHSWTEFKKQRRREAGVIRIS
ncbi:hypothetical protein RHOSPDRAFT_33641 [Rhodotorula sp. JG-1b]|nr:hypothetical protein RHOSPDRAFT_33641 [Rhodotorula sp. JG-1b]